MGIFLLYIYGLRGHMNTWLFFLKWMGIARRGVLKELEVCDFDKLGQHVNEMMAVAMKKF